MAEGRLRWVSLRGLPVAAAHSCGGTAFCPEDREGHQGGRELSVRPPRELLCRSSRERFCIWGEQHICPKTLPAGDPGPFAFPSGL